MTLQFHSATLAAFAERPEAERMLRGVYISADMQQAMDRAMQLRGEVYVQLNILNSACDVSPYSPGSWLCRTLLFTADGACRWWN